MIAYHPPGPSVGDKVQTQDGEETGVVVAVNVIDVGCSVPAVDIEIEYPDGTIHAMGPDKFWRHWKII